MKKYLLAAVFAAMGAVGAHAADFGGAYVGGDVDYSRADDAKGFGGGLNAGYGVELGKWYIGGEVDGGIGKVDGDNAYGDVKKKNYYGAVGRFGYKATDTVLAYGLVGLEGGKFEAATASGKVSDNDWGYRLGVGVETFVKDNVTLRGEVNYVDWQGENGLPGGDEWRTSVGVGYHF
jgi:opacity protein-like surface antigen